MSDFRMGTILGKGFAQAQVHTVNSTSAEGTSAIDSMHECLSKTLSQDCPHGEIAFSGSSHLQKFRFGFKKITRKNLKLCSFLSSTMMKWFCAKVFSIVDRSRDLFAKVFSIVDWSRDLSIMVK